MKRIKRLSFKKKKSECDETSDNVQSADKHLTKRNIFSKKYHRSKSLPEGTPQVLEAHDGRVAREELSPINQVSEAKEKVPTTCVATSKPCLNKSDREYEMSETNAEVFQNHNDVTDQKPVNESNNADYSKNEPIVTEHSLIDANECNDHHSLDFLHKPNDAAKNKETELDTSKALLPSRTYQSYLIQEFKRLALQGWYWGPLSRTEAEEKLFDMPDGSFLVRDSADERYLLSLSFRSFGRTLHTRIEHSNEKFSFYADGDIQSYTSVVELIEESVRDSQHSGVFCYSRFHAPQSPTLPVRLSNPVSRLSQVRSLQYLCRFVIRQYTRIDHIQELPLPNAMKGYVNQSYF